MTETTQKTMTVTESIKVSKNTKDSLDKLKVHRQTYDDVISSLLPKKKKN